MTAKARLKLRKRPTGARGPGRPSAANGGGDTAIRSHILDAALQIFSVQGFEGGSIAGIAQEYCVSTSLIHYYFKSKEELWRSAVDHGLSQMLHDLNNAISGSPEADCIDRLKHFIGRYIELIVERPAVFRLIVRENEVPGPRLAWLSKKYLQSYFALFVDLIAEAQAQGRLKTVVPAYHMAQIIAGACHQFLGSRNRILEGYGVDVTATEMRKQHAQAVIEVLFNGMITSVAPPPDLRLNVIQSS